MNADLNAAQRLRDDEKLNGDPDIRTGYGTNNLVPPAQPVQGSDFNPAPAPAKPDVDAAEDALPV